ncbi:apiosidase-like domain-containing protein [Streptococcus moroccensis]|uniref:Apiosidase-like catalytic domain-containing protein n=1 Tax=Streptococcus moroccensis TaxID=1451356 RepID=A0ABT9YRJ4_9STRE|nr:DUF4038 domain-containing protein [Streptococcus moroccensis]MDQ0222614.1 hypothetical protein [Streptococcus moroccensis]
MFQISKGKRYFSKNGEPVFYLADTCWSAFTNIEESDWEYYLDVRQKQGFNVIQVNMLWQWDSSQTLLNYKPFAVNEDGTFNFNQFNDVYFERAENMIKRAYEKGITIAIVLLWCNYLPNTWASDMNVRKVGLFPKTLLMTYIEKVVSLYNKYNPIYIISGDTDFQTDEVIEEYYNNSLNIVKQLAPNSLATLHIRGRESDIPEVLKNNQNLDFYMYQSGHNSEFQDMGYKLATEFYNMKPIRPVLNSEPCYEMMGYSRQRYGRFTREDIRKVAWQSVLSGGFAGLSYGAHGIWSWHNNQMIFDTTVGEAFETPYDWHDALKFEGAWDYGFLRKFAEKHNFSNITPIQELVANNTEEIRAAKVDDDYYIYVPFNIRLKLNGRLDNYNFTYLDLESKKEVTVTTQYDIDNQVTFVNLHNFIKDALLIIKCKKD